MYDDRHRETLHDFLKKKMAAEGPHFRTDSDEIARVGANMGLSPGEASALFESMRCVYWSGTLHTVAEESGWVLAVVERVA